MQEEEIIYSIALRKCTNIGDQYFHKLMNHYPSAKEVWQTPHHALHKVTGLGLKTLSDIGNDKHLDFAQAELKFCAQNEVKIIFRHKGQLPGWLSECNDAPAILYYKGILPKNANYLSIVGTRNMTAYGKQFVQDLLQALREMPHLHTVSGLALGVDAEVHEQSIHHDVRTIGVLAHGLHTLYPSRNRKLAEQILAHGGCLLSEFNSRQKANREHFIQRNRVVAGLSPATIVIETAFGGGSISTAHFANQYNRDVFALPGRIVDRYSQGCNKLIGENKAKTIFSISELIEDLGYSIQQKEGTGSLFSDDDLVEMNSLQQKICFEIQSKKAISLDELSLITQMSTKELMVELLQLELMGKIRCSSSRQYVIS